MSNVSVSRSGLLAFVVVAGSVAWTIPGRGWVLAVLLLGSCVGTGQLVIGSRWARGWSPSAVGSGLFSGLLGLWLLLVAAIGLASTRLLSPVSAALLVGLFVVFGLRGLWQQPTVSSRRRWAWSGWLILGGVVLLLAPYMLRSLLPDADWDGALYHLPMARHFVADGLWQEGLRPHALYRPGVVQSLYALCLALDTDSALIPSNCLALLALALTCYRAGVCLFDERVGRWAVAVLLSSGMMFEFAMDVRVEPFLVLFFALASLAAALWLQHRRPGDLLIAVMASGLLVGTKYNGLAFALVPLSLLSLGMIRVGLRPRLLALALVGLMLPSGVFYARNQLLFGNALHPYKSARRDPGTPDQVFGKDLAAVPAAVRPNSRQLDYIKQNRADSGHGTPEQRQPALVLVDAVLHPEDHASKPFHWLSPWLLVFVLVPVFTRSRRSLAVWATGIGAYALTVGLFASRGDFPIRYLAPLLPLLSLAVALCLARARRRITVAALALGVVLPLGYASYHQYRFLGELRPDRYLFGGEDESAFLSRVGYNGASFDAEGVLQWTNTDIPRLRTWMLEQIEAGELQPGDRVFAIAEAKTSRLPLDCLPSNGNTGRNFLNRLRRLDWDHAALARSLWSEGFRYLLVNREWMNYSNEYSVVSQQVLALAFHNLDEFASGHCRQPLEFGTGTLLFPLLDPER